MSIDRRRNLISLGLILGTIGGAIVAYFYAPRKGSDTKKELVRKANQMTQKSIVKTQDALIDLEVALEKSLKSDRENRI